MLIFHCQVMSGPLDRIPLLFNMAALGSFHGSSLLSKKLQISYPPVNLHSYGKSTILMVFTKKDGIFMGYVRFREGTVWKRVLFHSCQSLLLQKIRVKQLHSKQSFEVFMMMEKRLLYNIGKDSWQKKTRYTRFRKENVS